ncbi:unnamed protein product [Moneuplotes crassus]|uniref:Uncharacterized protein n=1 Tax=Euplotes crassus TaxID=5936 RepID=A0AAD1U3F1_EUPCR|nr:unnamed protein product [Moneuplotes crassus]
MIDVDNSQKNDLNREKAKNPFLRKSASRKPYEVLENNQFLFFSYERQKKFKKERLAGLQNESIKDFSQLITNETSDIKRRDIADYQFYSHTPRGGSAVRAGSKNKPKKCPNVRQSKKFFPSDFFQASPKKSSRGNSAVTRSEVRKNYQYLNKSNQDIDFYKNLEQRDHPFKRSIPESGIRCRSLSKNKVRPQSYKMKRTNLNNNDGLDSSFISNISAINPCEVNDTFISKKIPSLKPIGLYAKKVRKAHSKVCCKTKRTTSRIKLKLKHRQKVAKLTSFGPFKNRRKSSKGQQPVSRCGRLNQRIQTMKQSRGMKENKSDFCKMNKPFDIENINPNNVKNEFFQQKFKIRSSNEDIGKSLQIMSLCKDQGGVRNSFVGNGRSSLNGPPKIECPIDKNNQSGIQPPPNICRKNLSNRKIPEFTLGNMNFPSSKPKPIKIKQDYSNFNTITPKSTSGGPKRTGKVTRLFYTIENSFEDEPSSEHQQTPQVEMSLEDTPNFKK